MPEPLNSTTEDACFGFDGNPDLYGLGIRIGVYLQWYSTWLCISINSETAAEMHATNSIFVFAISVAVLRAMSNQTINAVEAYLMLQICLGYVLTLLSIFGLRYQLLHPRKLQAIKSAFSSLRLNKAKDQSFRDLEGDITLDLRPSMLRALCDIPPAYSLRLRELGSLKDATLSWTGTIWRLSIVYLVVVMNLLLLFGGMDSLPNHELCGTNHSILMFIKVDLHGPVLIFLKVVALVLVVVFGLIAILTFNFYKRILFFFEFLAFSDIMWWCLGKDFWRTPSWLLVRTRGVLGKFKRVAEIVRTRYGGFLVALSIVFPMAYFALLMLTSVLEAWGSLETPRKNYRSGEVFSIYALFSSGAYDTKTPLEADTWNGIPGVIDNWSLVISGLWHLWVISTMTWFVISVELGIKWNGIRGVQSLDTTGQLIPFLIGVLGFIGAKHKLLVFVIKRLYPKWHESDLEITFLGTVPVKFRVIRIEREPKFGISKQRVSSLPGTCTI